MPRPLRWSRGVLRLRRKPAIRGGAPKVAVHNAVGGAFANFLDVLERNFQVNVIALTHLGRWAAPLSRPASATRTCSRRTYARHWWMRRR